MLLLTAGQLVVHPHPQCFHKAALPAVSPLLVLLHEVTPPQGQKLHETPVGPFFQPVKVPLSSSTRHMQSPTQSAYTQQSPKGSLYAQPLVCKRPYKFF